MLIEQWVELRVTATADRFRSRSELFRIVFRVLLETGHQMLCRIRLLLNSANGSWYVQRAVQNVSAEDKRLCTAQPWHLPVSRNTFMMRTER